MIFFIAEALPVHFFSISAGTRMLVILIALSAGSAFSSVFFACLALVGAWLAHEIGISIKLVV